MCEYLYVHTQLVGSEDFIKEKVPFFFYLNFAFLKEFAEAETEVLSPSAAAHGLQAKQATAQPCQARVT